MENPAIGQMKAMEAFQEEKKEAKKAKKEEKTEPVKEKKTVTLDEFSVRLVNTLIFSI